VFPCSPCIYKQGNREHPPGGQVQGVKRRGTGNTLTRAVSLSVMSVRPLHVPARHGQGLGVPLAGGEGRPVTAGVSMSHPTLLSHLIHQGGYCCAGGLLAGDGVAWLPHLPRCGVAPPLSCWPPEVRVLLRVVVDGPRGIGILFGRRNHGGSVARKDRTADRAAKREAKRIDRELRRQRRREEADQPGGEGSARARVPEQDVRLGLSQCVPLWACRVTPGFDPPKGVAECPS
jgi:hypothetical protein